MALEYILSIDLEFSRIEGIIKEFYNSEDFLVSIDENFKEEKIIKIDFINLGFQSIFFRIIQKVLYNEEEFRFKTSILFRFEKEYEDIMLRNNYFINHLLLFLSKFSSDTLLCFNGEDMLFYRKNSRIVVNRFFFVWFDIITKQLGSSDYLVIDNNNEIDVYLEE